MQYVMVIDFEDIKVPIREEEIPPTIENVAHFINARLAIANSHLETSFKISVRPLSEVIAS